MPAAFTQTAPLKGALATTDGTWVVELREKDRAVGIEVRDAGTNTVAGWAPAQHQEGKWSLGEFTPDIEVPRNVKAEARRMFASTVV